VASITTSPSGLRISPTERLEIADQLSRVLTSSWFRSSSRCSQLLRHVVEVSVNGQVERLKERQIAIDAFRRKPTYDNNADPVVRVVAGEVRKRLAQYYSVPENAGQIRIELPIGSYVPIFHFTSPAEMAPDIETAAQHLEHLPIPEEIPAEQAESQDSRSPEDRNPRRQVWVAVGGALIVLAAVAGAWRVTHPAPKPSGFNEFWAMTLSSERSPLISVGELRARELTFTPDAQRNRLSDSVKIDMGNALPQEGIPVERTAYSQAVAKIASVLAARGKAFDVRGQSETTFADIMGRPTVLLGSYDSDWVIGICDGKRFQFKADNKRNLTWISDRNQPGREIGALSIPSPEPATYETFSIVLRTTGVTSQQTHVVVAGVGGKGTIAAAEFVSNPKYLDEFAKHAPKDWAKKNIEFLLETRVIENVVGIPSIVDYTIW
jgi:hypothetical protein